MALQYFQPTVDPVLNRIYDVSSSRSDKLSVSSTVSGSPTPEKPISSSPTEDDPRINDQILLRPDSVPDLVASLELVPSAEAEILRAIEQVKLRLKKEQSEN
jgi:hypothetical protein